ncbi:MAG: type VI secretion system protein IglI family protein [bacterium]
MNLEIINKTLEGAENPGFDTLDPRFSDITTLIQNGDYQAAAAQAEEALSENIYDIRIIGYFLYGVFIEQGVGAIGAIFQCLSRLLRENWQAVGPVNKREKHAQTSLNWLMKMLLKKMQYEEKKQGSDWNLWVDQVFADQVQEALDAGSELWRSLGAVLEDAAGPVVDGLIKVNDWLTAFQKVVYSEPKAEPEAAQGEDGGEGNGGGAEDSGGGANTGKWRTSEAIAPGAAMPALTFGEGAGAEGSYHLQILLKKLEAFERLIQGGKVPLAALVADDINNTITHFDPKVYFPRLFSKFSLLFALHIAELASCEGYKGTVAWQALEEVYKVDMDAFVELNLDGVNLGSFNGAGGADTSSGGTTNYSDSGEWEAEE